MRFLGLKKSESKLKIKVNEKDKLVKKFTNFSSNLTKEGEFYIKNNLALFMISLLALYNYNTTLKVMYLPILLGNKFLSNVGLITNLLNDL
uniref:Uncharacterized protein n=1 Tax=Nucleocytoviricota sp. TaxID=2809609 RepID=A0A9E8JYT2_9VIRU|nr:hypothetical protein [Nucleocytoviricota sp.]UZT29219.1 hypothetical protein [Nucleocytoviricota sp.]